MELPGTAFLYTLATLMVTFGGFSALLMIIRQTAGGHLSVLDRFLTRAVIGNLLTLMVGALLPPLLQLFAIPELLIWKASALAFGLPYLAMQVTFPYRRRRATGHAAPPLVNAIFVWLCSAVIVAMLACLFGNLADPAASGAIYIGAVTVNFFALAYTFVIALEVILKQQPVDPVRQSSHSGVPMGGRPDGHAHAASPE
jgi:hypothetical protein